MRRNRILETYWLLQSVGAFLFFFSLLTAPARAAVTYAGSGDDIPVAMAADNFGNVYVAAKTPGAGGFDILTIEYGPAGSVLWSARYGGFANAEDQGPSGIAVDGDG